MAIEPNSPIYRNPVKVNHTKKDRRRAPYPGSSRVAASIDSSAAPRAVYLDRDRIGQYRRQGDLWFASDRLDRPIGRYNTEREAASAISSAAGGAR